jgi:hypothetical protein
LGTLLEGVGKDSSALIGIDIKVVEILAAKNLIYLAIRTEVRASTLLWAGILVEVTSLDNTIRRVHIRVRV